MKPRYLVAVLLLFLCEPLPGQTHHYQYSHDTLGNRVSRVYQGTVPSKGNGMESGRIDPADTTVAQMAGILVDDSSYAGELQTRHYTEKDTIKVSPLVMTQAEKDAYLDSMMAAVSAMAIYDDGGTRDLSDYSVGAIPLEYGISGSGARSYRWHSRRYKSGSQSRRESVGTHRRRPLFSTIISSIKISWCKGKSLSATYRI